MRKGRVTIQLSAAQFREIGRIVVRFATMEWHLKILLYEVIGVDPKRGRLAVRDPRLYDYPNLIRDLLALDGKKPPPEAEGLSKDLIEADRLRNSVAHGIWMILPGQPAVPYLQHTTDTWKPDGKTDVKRKVTPEGIALGVAELREYSAFMLETLKRVTSYSKAISPPKPSPDKSAERQG